MFVLCAIITQNKDLTITQYIIFVEKMSPQIFDIPFEYGILLTSNKLKWSSNLPYTNNRYNKSHSQYLG